MDYFMEEPILNAHNKEEYPPMHTAEHILNGTMVKNTAEIGTFKILSHDYENGRWRVRWKVQ